MSTRESDPYSFEESLGNCAGFFVENLFQPHMISSINESNEHERQSDIRIESERDILGLQH